MVPWKITARGVWNFLGFMTDEKDAAVVSFLTTDKCCKGSFSNRVFKWQNPSSECVQARQSGSAAQAWQQAPLLTAIESEGEAVVELPSSVIISTNGREESRYFFCVEAWGGGMYSSGDAHSIVASTSLDWFMNFKYASSLIAMVEWAWLAKWRILSRSWWKNSENNPERVNVTNGVLHIHEHTLSNNSS